MFGLKKEEVEKLIDDKIVELREEMRKKFRDVAAPPDAQNLAREALQQIISQVNPREFLENLLVTKGLTLETMVRQAVAEYLQKKTEIIEAVTEKMMENAGDELDMDELYPLIAEKSVKYLREEGLLKKEDILEAVAEKLSENVWDELDMDELYPVIGEKVVELLKTAKD